ncbi:hypothetical protein FQN57_002621 [Myotisia sp. PD_48]|nr:hypothetical protein FQN57_002621 [Myotisia sp. PD_48]
MEPEVLPDAAPIASGNATTSATAESEPVVSTAPTTTPNAPAIESISTSISVPSNTYHPSSSAQTALPMNQYTRPLTDSSANHPAHGETPTHLTLGVGGHQQPHQPSAAANQYSPSDQQTLVNFPPAQQIDNGSQFHSINHGQPSYGTATPPGAIPATHITQYYSEIPADGLSPDGFELVTDESAANRMKKDVKRRTKTGCLTCRKRRIKCDERHPVCRNCEKSKRDCLGYDPVFRSQPSPSAIQPAPIQQPSLQVAPQNPLPAPSPSSTHPGTTSATSISSAPQAAPGLSTAQPRELFDFATAPEPTPITQALGSAPATSECQPQISMATALPGSDSLEMRNPKMEDLLALGGHPLPEIDEAKLSPTKVEEVKMLFRIYAKGMDSLLECSWYEAHGITHLIANTNLLSLYSCLLDGFADPGIHEPSMTARMEALETKVVWDSLSLCRIARSQDCTGEGNSATANLNPQLTYAVKRLSLLEILLTGTTLEHNPVARHNYPEDDPSLSVTGLVNQIKSRQLQFWESIGNYLSTSDNDPDANGKRDRALYAARTFLDSLENRDVIYSIAIVRHVSKFQPKKFQLAAASDEKDPAAKLYVGCRFLEDEVRGKATSQVVKRICGMIVKYWDQPFNI